jgi:hypothetical protein
LVEEIRLAFVVIELLDGLARAPGLGLDGRHTLDARLHRRRGGIVVRQRDRARRAHDELADSTKPRNESG